MSICIEKAGRLGNARCAAMAWHLCPLDADGYVATRGFDVPPGEDLMAKRGAQACPERIAFVEDDE